MSPPASGPLVGVRQHSSARRGGVRPGGVHVRVAKSVQRSAGPAGIRLAVLGPTALAHGIGQGDQVVLVGVGGQRAGVAHQLPSAGRGDTSGVVDTQIPRMRFPHSSEWTYDCRRVRVDERQGRYGVMRTPGPAAATGNVHERKAIVRKRHASAGHAQPASARCSTVTIGAWAIRAAPRPVAGREAGPVVGRLHTARLGVAAIYAVRCCHRRCRDGAAGPSGSTWLC